MKQIFQAVAVVCVLALGACAYPNPEHVSALNQLIGKSETQLVQAMGVPSRSYDSGGHRFLAFSKSRIDTIPGSSGPYGRWWGGYGGGYWGGGWGGWGGGWGGFPPEVVTRDCETTFDLVGGVVKSWGLRGNDC
jgi:hypothetical protein